MDIIVGTAGHIDHGKTALIKALTGIDADRLPEEKQRGISIDLGFAELDLGGARIGFVDVPGHERFVKNMLAGASGIDLVLFVIAADEGVMPQTREHFEICRLLGVRKGLIVLTKCDLVDDELLEIVKLESVELVENSFLDNAPMIAISSKTGDGIEDLKLALADSVKTIEARNNEMITRLPIDRSFTVKGFGTVVTGTLASGKIGEADEMELIPAGTKVRVRGLQVHGKEVKTLVAGQRAAVNLGGIDYDDVARGMLLTERGVLHPTQIIDTELEVLKHSKKALRSRQRVRLHIGTLEVLARILVLNHKGEISQGDKDFVQLRVEMPIIAIPGERFIIRSYSPPATIGGGLVLDGLAKKTRKKDMTSTIELLQILADKTIGHAKKIGLYVEAAGEKGLGFADLQARTGWRRHIVQHAIEQNLTNGTIKRSGVTYVEKKAFDKLKDKIVNEIEVHYRRQPLSAGVSLETIREKVFSYLPAEIFKTLLIDLEKEQKIVTEKELVRLAGRNTELSAEDAALQERIVKTYTSAGVEPPKLEDALADSIKNSKIGRDHARNVFQLLLNSGVIVKVSEELYFSRPAIQDLLEKLGKYVSDANTKDIDVAKFKEIAGISRKYAIPLLEYFDREKITMRVGDKRQIL